MKESFAGRESRVARGEAIDLKGLIGVPYAEANCWGVVVAALARMGVVWPLDHGEAALRADELVEVLPAGAVLNVGDVLQFAPGPDGRTHVGIVVDGNGERFLHAMGSGGGGRLSALARVGSWRSRVARVLRPRGLGGVYHRDTEGAEKMRKEVRAATELVAVNTAAGVKMFDAFMRTMEGVRRD